MEEGLNIEVSSRALKPEGDTLEGMSDVLVNGYKAKAE